MAKLYKLFSKRLKQARLHAGISQRKLGLELGIDILSAGIRMNQYEAGSARPRFETAVEIAKILSVPPSYFYEPDDILAKIILDSGKLSPRQRKTIAEQIKTLANKVK